MNADELMLGDYVQIQVDDNQFETDYICSIGYVPQWNELGVRTCKYGEEWLRESEVMPIRLTEDILKKNNFHWGHTVSEEDYCTAVGCSYPDKGWCYDEGAGEIKIIFPNNTDGGLIRLDDQGDDRHLEIIFIKHIYVHELQHLFKLCHIDKEIQL